MNIYTICTPISSIMRGFACVLAFLENSSLQAQITRLEDVF